MNSAITLEEAYGIIHKVDANISNDFYDEFQPEKELTRLKIEIFVYLIIYIGKVAFREISMAEALLLGNSEERKNQFYVNFARALTAYYSDITEQQLSNIFDIAKNNENKYPVEELEDYISNYFPDLSPIFTGINNEFLNTNPLEITDFVSGNYRSVQGLNFDFDNDIKTIVKSDGYHKNATLKNTCLPYVFSSYAILCLKKIQNSSPFVSTNMVNDIANDVWNCVVKHLPHYVPYKDEYFERLNREIFNVHSVRHAIDLMKLSNIELTS